MQEVDGGREHTVGFGGGDRGLGVGVLKEELFIGYTLQKLLMAVLHDWAFVTARVLPATSACGTVLHASEPGFNHLPQITKEAVSSPTDHPLLVLGLVIKGKYYI